MYYVIIFHKPYTKESGRGDPKMNNKDIVELILKQSPFIRIKANGNKKSIAYAEILEKHFQKIDLNISANFEMPWAGYENFIYHLLSGNVTFPENFHLDIVSMETEIRVALNADEKPGAEITQAIDFIEELTEHGNFSCKVSKESIPDGLILVFAR